MLVIHLMRFGFDWESGRSIKYDEQIRVSIYPSALAVSLSTGLQCHKMFFLCAAYNWWLWQHAGYSLDLQLTTGCVYSVWLKFPWVLNMEPYTVSGMARQDSSVDHGDNGRGGEAGSGGSPRKKVTISENYELVGVVVHSGQAHAGHYYSFIKDRR